MTEVSNDAPRDAIRNRHGCDSTWVAAVSMTETFDGKTVWEGEVQVFDLIGYPSATRCYAWSHSVDGSEQRRFFAVLHIPPIVSPVDAVRAAIIAESKFEM